MGLNAVTFVLSLLLTEIYGAPVHLPRRSLIFRHGSSETNLKRQQHQQLHERQPLKRAGEAAVASTAAIAWSGAAAVPEVAAAVEGA